MVAARDDEPYVDRLVETGLSRADSELIVRRFLDDVAVCAFESTRRYYEDAGTPFEEFDDPRVESTDAVPSTSIT